ncbi:beta-propeller domain-containing protein [Terrimonas pollutisoli]|uniref:beta-propeller domain-containing protein n=1 Tax=Terrimonas pollutisoli TaxID=3034147 RepID=UPI0023EB2861|nr:hypothetical protein [Terrimonas sp. H1YJ31]
MITMFRLNYILLLGSFLFTAICFAQGKTYTDSISPIRKPLPGLGLQQHDFLYTGEWDYRKPVQTIYILRKGKIVWSHDIPFHDPATGEMEELGDATMRPNGNIAFCRKTGASEITPDKKMIWNYEAPKGTEIHSVEPIGTDKILMVINGAPAIIKLINIKTGQTEKELTLPTGSPKPHGQFRRVRMTKAGTLLAAHMDAGKVSEYDWSGKEIWSINVKSPWLATRLKNGNTLITSNHGFVIEVNKNGETVWEVNQNDLRDFKLYIPQVAVRLANGNTVITNWCPNGIKKPEDWPGSVQILEVTRDKKLVWALSQWSDPDLGPASSFQLLDEPTIKKSKGYLKRYK